MRGARAPRLLEHGVDLGRRAHVVRERHPSPAAAVLDARESSARLARLQSAKIMPPAWKKTTSSAGPCPTPPAECLVEGARPREVGDAERDQREQLLHHGDAGTPPQVAAAQVSRAAAAA